MKILYSHDYPDDTVMEISIRPDSNAELKLSFTSEDPDYGTETMIYVGDTSNWRKVAAELKKKITYYLDNMPDDQFFGDYMRTTLIAFENLLTELGFGQEEVALGEVW